MSNSKIASSVPVSTILANAVNSAMSTGGMGGFLSNTTNFISPNQPAYYTSMTYTNIPINYKNSMTGTRVTTNTQIGNARLYIELANRNVKLMITRLSIEKDGNVVLTFTFSPAKQEYFGGAAALYIPEIGWETIQLPAQHLVTGDFFEITHTLRF